MTDDPRDILKAAGVECAEVDDYGCRVDHPVDEFGNLESPYVVLAHASGAVRALATRLAAIVSYFDDEKNIDSAAPWALGEIRRILAEHNS